MLTPEFSSQLESAAPQHRVSAILSWRKLHSLPPQASGLLSQIARMKKPLLNRLESMDGVRVNPLPGMPMAIIEASAATWRNLLKDNSRLRDGDDVEVVANRPDFHTQNIG